MHLHVYNKSHNINVQARCHRVYSGPISNVQALSCVQSLPKFVHRPCAVGYNEYDFFLENEEYRPFDGSKIEI